MANPETTDFEEDDPESILLYGIEQIAEQHPSASGGFAIMNSIGANQFASEILMAYWKAKARVKAA